MNFFLVKNKKTCAGVVVLLPLFTIMIIISFLLKMHHTKTPKSLLSAFLIFVFKEPSDQDSKCIKK